MKYIRTKDGIEKLDADREHLAEYMNGKQADTIEELCDEFIAIPLFDVDVEVAGLPIHVKKGTHYLVRRESIKKYIGTVEKGTSVLYGMIWVDDNLIKAARMNEKGELELL